MDDDDDEKGDDGEDSKMTADRQEKSRRLSNACAVTEEKVSRQGVERETASDECEQDLPSAVVAAERA